MADIFISYAREDREKIEKLASNLEDEGYSVWWDRQIVGGAEYAKDIEHALDEAKAVIVAWSADANESGWVRDEASRAQHQNKLVPIRLEHVEPPMGFGQYQVIDFESAWRHANAPEMDDLKRAIDLHISGDGSSAALSSSAPHKSSQSVFFEKPGILAALGAVALVVVLGLIFWTQRGPSEETTNTPVAATAISDKSVAVLPFIDLSPDQDQAYFSDGLSEELLNLLAKVPDLRVAARTSSFAFRGKEVQTSEIAEALKVGHVLEGSVRMAGERVRITAQLIDGKNGYHLWSETYDRTMDDIFEVQDDIAAQIVKTLKVNILGQTPKAYATDATAYALYLRGRHLHQQFTPEAMKEAEELYGQVVDIDPDYAPVWTNLSSIYINRMIGGDLSLDVGCKLARDAAQKALDIDETFAAGYAKLASIAQGCDKDTQAAAKYFEQALGIDPSNPAILGDAAVLAESLGRLELAIALKEHQVERQPVDAIAHNNLALAYYFAGRYDEAEVAIRTVIAVSPDYMGAHYRLGAILLMRGDAAGALEAFSREKDDEYRTKGSALAHFALGDTDEADAQLEALIKGWGEVWPTEVAQVYAYRNEADPAFEWLEKRYEKDGPGGWGEQKLDRLLDNLRDDPRWEPFLQKMQVADNQLAKIEFNITPP